MDNAIENAIAALEHMRNNTHSALFKALASAEQRDICRKSLETALTALRAQAERENPPVALTLEQLRERDGKTVFIPENTEFFSGWGVVDFGSDGVVPTDGSSGGFYPFDSYGDWFAYDRPPERGA